MGQENRFYVDMNYVDMDKIELWTSISPASVGWEVCLNSYDKMQAQNRRKVI